MKKLKIIPILFATAFLAGCNNINPSSSSISSPSSNTIKVEMIGYFFLIKLRRLNSGGVLYEEKDNSSHCFSLDYDQYCISSYERKGCNNKKLYFANLFFI